MAPQRKLLLHMMVVALAGAQQISWRTPCCMCCRGPLNKDGRPHPLPHYWLHLANPPLMGHTLKDTTGYATLPHCAPPQLAPPLPAEI
jgi:hypothetical protein